MEKEFVFKVMGEGKATIKLTDNSITISRQGIMSKLSYGLVGEKTILLSQIMTLILLKKTKMVMKRLSPNKRKMN